MRYLVSPFDGSVYASRGSLGAGFSLFHAPDGPRRGWGRVAVDIVASKDSGWTWRYANLSQEEHLLSRAVHVDFDTSVANEMFRRVAVAQEHGAG